VFKCARELRGEALLYVTLYVNVLNKEMVDKISEAGSEDLQRDSLQGNRTEVCRISSSTSFVYKNSAYFFQ